MTVPHPAYRIDTITGDAIGIEVIATALNATESAVKASGPDAIVVTHLTKGN